VNQHQEQQQLAFAEGELPQDGTEQLAMSRHRSRSEDAVYLLAAGAMTAAAAGLAGRRATRWAYRPARASR
jgi:hypothetical protein